MSNDVFAWHFVRADKTLGYGDGRKIRKGTTLKVEGAPVLCEHGLHASPRALDALAYAPGPIACYVRLGGVIVGPNDKHNDKMAATERTVIAYVDATPILREFLRDTLVYRQPHIVSLLKKANLPEQAQAIEQVNMGTASLADIQTVFDAAWAAARDAARTAARYAAWDAARNAADEAEAAVAAARAAAWTAARAAADEAEDAAWAAARDDMSTMLETRLFAAMKIEARQ